MGIVKSLFGVVLAIPSLPIKMNKGNNDPYQPLVLALQCPWTPTLGVLQEGKRGLKGGHTCCPCDTCWGPRMEIFHVYTYTCTWFGLLHLSIGCTLTAPPMARIPDMGCYGHLLCVVSIKKYMVYSRLAQLKRRI